MVPWADMVPTNHLQLSWDKKIIPRRILWTQGSRLIPNFHLTIASQCSIQRLAWDITLESQKPDEFETPKLSDYAEAEKE